MYVVHLTRTTNYTPSYNVYLDNNSKASNLSVTNYTDTPVLHSGDNTYYVTSKVGNNESCPSNNAKIVVVDGTRPENNLAIDESLVYLIEDGGTLTASGTLTCSDPDRLIINDGGQIVSSTSGVQATVKKDITAYTQNDGWHLIASPMTENLTASNVTGLLSNNYDLYTFNQSEELEWRNYETQSFSIKNKTGYLYANSGNPTLVFQGTLAANATATELSYDGNAEFKGFNLIGNPYPCNAYLTGRDFYQLQEGENGSEFVCRSSCDTG